MYEYDATVIRWVDGDTVVLDVDLGFRLRSTQSFRLAGVDTPELRPRSGTPEEREEEKVRAKAATRFCEDRCPVGSEVRIRTDKAGKYGRWLVHLMYMYQPTSADLVDELDPEPRSLNEDLVFEGHAVRYPS